MGRETALEKRVRYYHSQIDMELLASGCDYSELPDTYVIFICDYDPFGGKRYCYTFETSCNEDASIEYHSGSKSIFLSTCGENESEVTRELVKFLKFVKADLKESEEDFEDDFVKKIQKSIHHIKGNREMEERFMLMELLLRDERREGRAEGVGLACLDILSDLGDVPSDLEKSIMEETDLEILKNWIKLAAKADSIESFLDSVK